MSLQFSNVNENIYDIRSKLNNFSLNNIMWSSLFSGMGIINPLTEKDVERFFKLNKSDNNTKDLLSNYVPIKCIYAKGHPIFVNPPVEILNPGKYMWDFDSFDRSISLSAQAFLILDLCIAAELLYESSITDGLIALKSARLIYDFISTYLRNEDGLFVNGVDKTKDFEKDLKIKISSKKVNLYEQILVFEASLYLHNVSCDEYYKEYKTSKSETFINEALSLFDYIHNNYQLLFDLSTKDIALSISSLSRCCSITADTKLKENLRFLIFNLMCELEARIVITGEVKDDLDRDVTSSVISHFKVYSAMLEGFMQIGVEKFKDIAERIYNTILDLYDPALGLFLMKDYNHISYTISDIAEIIKSFLLNEMIYKNSNSLETLRSFYDFSIDRSGIVQSIVKKIINSNSMDIILGEHIPLMDEINKAPIFLKNLKFKISKKNTTYEISKSYNSLYGLYASYLFLFYFNKPLT